MAGGYQTTAAASTGYRLEFTESWMRKAGKRNMKYPSLIPEAEVCKSDYHWLRPGGLTLTAARTGSSEFHGTLCRLRSGSSGSAGTL
jgi:hypothetical protein